jgi:hypothetical protein
VFANGRLHVAGVSVDPRIYAAVAVATETIAFNIAEE